MALPRTDGATKRVFDGVASYAVAFKGTSCEARLSARPPNRPIPSQPLDASTTHRLDFQRHPTQQPILPTMPIPKPVVVKVQECSSYGYDFGETVA